MRLLRVVFAISFFCFMPAMAVSQGSGSLRGKVSDPSGAVVARAEVTAVSENGQTRTTSTNNLGEYEFSSLPAGNYTVMVSAKGFSRFEQTYVSVPSGQVQNFDVALGIQVEKEKVDVEDQVQGVDTAASNNAGAIVIKGKDLDALSDNPDDLQAELEALAGPTAGPNGGQIYIDGFTGGQLPPKSSIREIRINQNPFSAEFDKLGYGRIEILTKPGTDKVHGRVMMNGNSSAFNTGNPFAKSQPDYHSTFFMGNIGGPMGKKASYFLSMFRRDMQTNAIVNAAGVDAAGNLSFDDAGRPRSFVQAVLTPRSRLDISPRIDYQLTPNNTLTARYSYHRSRSTNSGIGGFNLPSMGINSESEEHEIQLSDSQIINSRIVNETRFEYSRERTFQRALSTDPTIMVRGAFTSGGSQQGNEEDLENYIEIHNSTSIAAGTHLYKFGVRLRNTNDVNTSSGGFNGAFVFDSIYSYMITKNAMDSGITDDAQIRAICMPDPEGRRDPQDPEQPMMWCGGASQYSVTTGNSRASINLIDAGLFFQDDWKIRPYLTLSYGLRFETQNHFSDKVSLAPRVSLAWGLGSSQGKPASTVIRAGYGWFYDRLPYSSVLMQDRQLEGGSGYTETFVENPQYPDANLDAAETVARKATTLYRANPNLHAPYTMQTAVSIERAWTKAITTSLTYLNSRGLHQFLTTNLNAPAPGEFNADNCAIGRPNGECENIYQFQSEGIFKQNQLIANFRVNGKKASLFGFYTLNFARSNTSGIGYFPSDPYDWMADYGRSSFDVRHRFLVGGNLTLPYGISAAPFMVVNSGQPYNITLGEDINGDNQHNDRPWYAAGVSLSCTDESTFSQVAGAGQRIPINYCTGPSQVTFNLRLSKTVGFGPLKEGAASAQTGPGGPPHGGPGGRGPGGPGGGLGPGGLTGGGGGGGMRGMFGGGSTNRRYALTFAVMAHNLFNIVNYAAPVGTVSSPFFGQSTSIAGGMFGNAAANRTIDLQMMFTF